MWPSCPTRHPCHVTQRLTCRKLQIRHHGVKVMARVMAAKFNRQHYPCRRSCWHPTGIARCVKPSQHQRKLVWVGVPVEVRFGVSFGVKRRLGVGIGGVIARCMKPLQHQQKMLRFSIRITVTVSASVSVSVKC